jgi:hypothetical protein
VRPKPIKHYDLPLFEGRRQEVLYVRLEGQGIRFAPSIVITSPITPSKVIEAIRVVFLP